MFSNGIGENGFLFTKSDKKAKVYNMSAGLVYGRNCLLIGGENFGHIPKLMTTIKNRSSL